MYILMCISIPLSICVAVYTAFETQTEGDAMVSASKIGCRRDALISGSVCLVGLFAVLIVSYQVYQITGFMWNLKRFLLLAVMIAAAYIDHKKEIIPNRLVVVALLIRLLIYMAEFIVYKELFLSLLLNDLIALVIPLAFYLVGTFLVRNGIGMGDVKLLIIISLFLGLSGALATVFFGLVAAFFFSVFLLVTKKKGRRDSIPFGPSLLLGVLTAAFLGGL